jgi:hypothetical protein
LLAISDLAIFFFYSVHNADGVGHEIEIERDIPLFVMADGSYNGTRILGNES